MKKIRDSLQRPQRRLRLDAETLRVLVDGELSGVRGGSNTVTTLSTGTKDTSTSGTVSKIGCPVDTSACPVP